MTRPPRKKVSAVQKQSAHGLAAPGLAVADESHVIDRKSLRKITGRTADFHELAHDCVCFANGAGGELLVGLEIVNPGRLPLGVTPRNILHESRRRNDGMARVFHDLKLMEREGSGIDLIYDRLLTSGRAAPEVSEVGDSVHVVVPRRVASPGVIRLIEEADARHQHTQRERIVLGMVAQSDGLNATELAVRLELNDPARLRGWMGRLVDLGLVEQAGRTKATRYYVQPSLLRGAGLDLHTTLSRMQPHRLRALILEDLERYPDSGRVDIHRRIGPEIHPKTVTRMLDALTAAGAVVGTGVRRWRKYRLADSDGHES